MMRRGDDAGRPDVYYTRARRAAVSRTAGLQGHRHPDTRCRRRRSPEDGRYLIIGLFDGYETIRLARAGPPQAGLEAAATVHAWDALYNFLGSKGDELYFQTTKDARAVASLAVMAQDPAAGTGAPWCRRPEYPINGASYIGSRLVLEYKHDARSLVRLFGADRLPHWRSAMPGLGTATGSRDSGDNPETFFSYSDYLSPTRVLRLDVAPGCGERVPHADRWPADFSPYVTEQVFYAAKDGPRVPMFITHRKDAPRDGDRR